ncbi:hypothetical protein [Halobaculum sp. EA56]|uniref:hypothetical protein n=1 Tax=Halobaculum sp. EA56 TaxID=3421648 RepID=UPI003EB84971
MSSAVALPAGETVVGLALLKLALLAPVLGQTGSGYTPDGIGEIVSRIKNLATIPSDKLDTVLFTAFMTPIIQFFLKAGEAIGVVFDTVIVPMKALIDGTGQLILALVGGAAGIIGAGAESTAESLLTGVWSALGPLNYALAIASVLGGLLLMYQFLQEPETPNWIGGLISAVPDLPGPLGTAEEEE